MATYRVFWSEGDPRVVVAPSFNEALQKFVAVVHAEDAAEVEQRNRGGTVPVVDLSPPEDIMGWIESVEKLSDEDPIQ